MLVQQQEAVKKYAQFQFGADPADGVAALSALKQLLDELQGAAFAGGLHGFREILRILSAQLCSAPALRLYCSSSGGQKTRPSNKQNKKNNKKGAQGNGNFINNNNSRTRERERYRAQRLLVNNTVDYLEQQFCMQFQQFKLGDIEMYIKKFFLSAKGIDEFALQDPQTKVHVWGVIYIFLRAGKYEEVTGRGRKEAG